MEITIYVVLNSVGLLDAVSSGTWRLRGLYEIAYVPLAALCLMMGVAGWWPRARATVAGEGYERRWFYGAVWSVTLGQLLLWLLWKTVPAGRMYDLVKLCAYWGALAIVGQLARRGVLPRTRPILPGESVVVD
jgi:hypothetical protein